uniref:Beta-defensin n=1 Tax=Balaenoptera musculus TaxID=9771 RepID=A0A8C0DNB2_BALMU
MSNKDYSRGNSFLFFLTNCFLHFLARGGLRRQLSCLKMEGRCEVECLSFENKIGGCRAELTPFCCKKRIKN